MCLNRIHVRNVICLIYCSYMPVCIYTSCQDHVCGCYRWELVMKLTKFGFPHDKKVFAVCFMSEAVFTQFEPQNWNIFQFVFPLLLRVSLCCYCESSVHSKTVCVPWAQIGKSSASILGAFMRHWLVFHRRARSDQRNKDVKKKEKKKGCLLNVWLCKTKSFRFTGCFHNQTDCNMESCASGNTGVVFLLFWDDYALQNLYLTAFLSS